MVAKRKTAGFWAAAPLVACAVLAGHPRAGGAEAGSWKVGLASVKITPDEPVRMAGYASRVAPSQGVVSDLYAKALALEDTEGNRAVLLTTDVLGFPASVANPTCEQIARRTGLQRRQILLSSSHVHTGPVIELDAANLDFPKGQAEATVRYTRGLQKKLVALAERSLAELQPGRLSWGLGVAKFVMNRREFTDRGVRLGVNPRGLADRSVLVLRVDRPDGRLRGVLFGAACHNTTLTGKHVQISGDFAGYAQQAIERARPGVRALFIQGCAGDANPYPRGTEELAREHGDELGREVLRVLETDLQPLSGPLRTEWEQVALPLRGALSEQEIEELERGSGGWRRFVAEGMRKLLEEGKPIPTHYTAPLALWRFGDGLTLVALPGEAVVDYVAMLENALGPQRLWVAAYCNDLFGYLPSAKVLREGGYETRGLYAGGVGLFAPEVEDVVVKAVRKLARRAGRPESGAR